MGWFDSLKRGFSKTAQILNTDVRDLFRAGEILTEDKLTLYHKRLISTDMGVVAADALIVEIREKHLGRTVVLDELWQTIHDKLESLLRGSDDDDWDPELPLSPLIFSNVGPTVILVAGVNGVGKTTSIAKLANLLKKNGKRVVLAAGDTFRAAAVEQLTLWSQRIGVEIVTKPSQSDPAAVAHAGCARTKELEADVLIVDTAGRLHTEVNLMNQLTKIRRVINSQIPGAPHETLLVLDAVTGQNGITQAKMFSAAADCTGIILAKLDGTARGGIVVAIRQQMLLPVKYVGVGEQIDDLQVFNPSAFVDALLSVRP